MNRGAQIVRPWDGRLIAGVCAGLSERTGVDANLLRAAFMLLALASGVGVVAYVLLWLLMPPVGDRRSKTFSTTARSNLKRFRGEMAFSRRKFQSRWAAQARNYQIAAIALFATGGLIFLWSFGAMSWMTSPRLIALAAIVGGLGVLLASSRRSRR